MGGGSEKDPSTQPPTPSTAVTAYQARVQRAVADFYARARRDPDLRAELEEERDRAARPKRVKSAVPLERDEQRTLVDWLRAHRIDYAANLEGVYLGQNKRARWRQAAIMRRAGAKRGRPDIEITTRAPKHPEARGVAIELKRRVGGRTSPEQLECHERLRADGWLVRVCHGAGEAIAWLEELGYGR